MSQNYFDPSCFACYVCRENWATVTSTLALTVISKRIIRVCLLSKHNKFCFILYKDNNDVPYFVVLQPLLTKAQHLRVSPRSKDTSGTLLQSRPCATSDVTVCSIFTSHLFLLFFCVSVCIFFQLRCHTICQPVKKFKVRTSNRKRK